MAKRTRIVNEGGINGTGEGVVNINSKDYKALQKAVLEHSSKRSKQDKIQYKFISIRLQMNNYLLGDSSDGIKTIGYFLKEFIQALGVKNKEFANYIELEESNLSSIIGGRRKLNTELAFILGSLFKIEPNMWLTIQSKNELLKLKEKETSKQKRYNLEDFLKSVG